MIDKFELGKMARRALGSKSRVAVYEQLSDLALEQAKASNNVGQLDIAEAWTEIAEFCMTKIVSETDELKKVSDILKKMREES